MSDPQSNSRLEWLEDQLANLHRWNRELRTLDPANFHQEIERIEAHSDWLETQIRRLEASQGRPRQTS